MTLGPRKPLVVHVGELRRRTGTRADLRREAVLDDLALSTSGVVPGGVVVVEGALESIADGVVVTGTVSAPWEAACRRCLSPITDRLTVPVREVFVRNPIEGETWPLAGDQLDLEPMVREAVLLALPLAPLCRPDCAGVGPEAAAPGGDEEETEGGDPRWAALDQLRFD